VGKPSRARTETESANQPGELKKRLKRYLTAIENPHKERNINIIANEYSTANSFSHFSFLKSLLREILLSIFSDNEFLKLSGTGAERILTDVGSKVRYTYGFSALPYTISANMEGLLSLMPGKITNIINTQPAIMAVVK
jgi:hypothetical protein